MSFENYMVYREYVVVISHGAECNMGNIFRVAIFCNLFYETLGEWIIAKYEKQGKYLPILHEATCDKNFLCVRFMEDDYGWNVHVGLEKCVRFMECPL